jgi:ABC-type polysaccharide/polyol phosphate export permease
VRTAFWKFLPTMLVFFAAALFSGIRFSWVTLLAIPMFGLIAVFSTGLAMLLATAQVYFRDTTSFLPYFTRIWLYTSPVLYTIDQIPQKFKAIEVFNPLYGLIGGWGEILVGGTVPELRVWLLSLAWAVGTFLLGAFYFISRERDFAVRL